MYSDLWFEKYEYGPQSGAQMKEKYMTEDGYGRERPQSSPLQIIENLSENACTREMKKRIEAVLCRCETAETVQLTKLKEPDPDKIKKALQKPVRIPIVRRRMTSAETTIGTEEGGGLEDDELSNLVISADGELEWLGISIHGQDVVTLKESTSDFKSVLKLLKLGKFKA